MLCTKEEVLEITNWCKDHHVSYKKRLEQLNLKPYQFYDARAKYAQEQKKSNSKGEFVQLSSGGPYVQEPDFSAMIRPKSASQPRATKMSIEMKLTSGTMVRFQGEFDNTMLLTILQAASGNVQP